jgi:hypothetical protein
LTSELGVDLQQVWGGLKYILNILQKYQEGSYIILRDPTKVRLVAVIDLSVSSR